MRTLFYLDDHEYIALCDLLKACGIADSGGQAKAWIADGRVQRGDTTETRKTAKIRAGETVTFQDTVIEIRSGYAE